MPPDGEKLPKPMRHEVKLQRDLLDLLLTLAPLGLGVLEAEGDDAALKKLRRTQVGRRDPAACRRIVTAINEHVRKRTGNRTERVYTQALNAILFDAGIAGDTQCRLANPEIWAALDALPALLYEKILTATPRKDGAEPGTSRHGQASATGSHVDRRDAGVASNRVRPAADALTRSGASVGTKPDADALTRSGASDGTKPGRPGLVPPKATDDFQALKKVAEGLLGLRLGRHGRHVLLHATPPAAVEPPWVPQHSGDHRISGVQEAVRRLRAAGLVTTEPVRVRDHNRLGARLTALGEAVVEVVGDRLRDGHPVRWPRVLPAILAVVSAHLEPRGAP